MPITLAVLDRGVEVELGESTFWAASSTRALSCGERGRTAPPSGCLLVVGNRDRRPPITARVAPSYERSTSMGVTLLLPGGRANLGFVRMLVEEQRNRISSCFSTWRCAPPDRPSRRSRALQGSSEAGEPDPGSTDPSRRAGHARQEERRVVRAAGGRRHKVMTSAP